VIVVNSISDMKALAQSCAQRLAATAPSGWNSVVFYSELLDVDGEVDQASIVRCVDEKGSVLDFHVPFDVRMTIREAFENQVVDGDQWSGFKVLVDVGGKYRSKLYYGTTPHLSGEFEAAKHRVTNDDY
jgi:hypothetical protein